MGEVRALCPRTSGVPSRGERARLSQSPECSTAAQGACTQRGENRTVSLGPAFQVLGFIAPSLSPAPRGPRTRGPWLTASMWMDGDWYEAMKGTNGHGAPHQLECPVSVCRDSGSEPSSGTSSVIAGLGGRWGPTGCPRGTGLPGERCGLEPPPDR